MWDRIESFVKVEDYASNLMFALQGLMPVMGSQEKWDNS